MRFISLAFHPIEKSMSRMDIKIIYSTRLINLNNIRGIFFCRRQKENVARSVKKKNSSRFLNHVKDMRKGEGCFVCTNDLSWRTVTVGKVNTYERGRGTRDESKRDRKARTSSEGVESRGTWRWNDK